MLINMAELVEKLVEGRVIQYSITLVEGKNFKEYKAHLVSQNGLTDDLADMSDSDIMRALGAPGRHPEGQFAPQTYFYTKGDSDFDVLAQAYQRQQTVLNDAWASRAEDVQSKYGVSVADNGVDHRKRDWCARRASRNFRRI